MEKSAGLGVWLAMIGGILVYGGRVTVHLVVHDDATFRDHDVRAEEEVDGRRQRDGQSGSIHGRDLGCTMAVVTDQQGQLPLNFLCKLTRPGSQTHRDHKPTHFASGHPRSYFGSQRHKRRSGSRFPSTFVRNLQRNRGRRSLSSDHVNLQARTENLKRRLTSAYPKRMASISLCVLRFTCPGDMKFS